uniref:Phosphomannose isomerase type I catalytic domain-containing protein n=1 Tax=Lactuca sativa TaxID=4236 RepID=A0A9R1XY70_LACSA|nr:hypothetical protein LSAT_V11C100028600 [Lactuca sativa]
MDIPVIDLTPYVNVVSGEFCLDDIMNPEVETVCMEVSWILRDTGALFVKDPRCSAEDDDQFISMMEKYFEMPDDFKLLQARPHQHYQSMHEKELDWVYYNLMFVQNTQIKRTMEVNGDKHEKHLVKLKCSIQNYNWGRIGYDSRVVMSFERNCGDQIKENKHYIGTHVSRSSFFEETDNVSLKNWILQNTTKGE